MDTFNFSSSRALFERAGRVIPGGIYGHYGLAKITPETPLYFSKAEGSHFVDVDGNRFIDYMCAYGPSILGYNHPVVEAAAREQFNRGNTVTLSSPVMIELAEKLVELITIADWAFFAKNGGDVTNLATMVARAATGRKKILKINDGYHGVAPWMQAPESGGTVDEDFANIISIDWNSTSQLEQAISDHKGLIAGFISSPYHHPVFQDNVMPEKDYWAAVEKLCRREGIVLIVDDVRAGFRIDLRGSNEFFGFKPDLICLGKALANGYPISALVGTEALREAVQRVFCTGTMYFGAAPMAAALANIAELIKNDVATLINQTGRKLADGLTKVAADNGFDLKVSGPYSMPYLRITNGDDMTLHNDWIARCVERGAYFLPYHNHFISAAHTDADLEETLGIANDAFQSIKQ
jgi:glutamate-1-semialdehyde 2,1-aminomutase